MNLMETLLVDRPEQTFFDDPALDRAFGVVMALATEVYVQRDRLRALERQLQDANVINIDDLDQEPGDAERQTDAIDREQFVEGLLINLLGRQQAKGATQGGRNG